MKAPPFWAMYLAVPKLDEAVAHIKRRGGRDLSPVIEVPTVGRMQMVKRSAGRCVLHHSADTKGRTNRNSAGDRRGVVARTDDHRCARGDEVLQRRLQLATG